MHRPWGEEKVRKQTEKLSTARALLCFVGAQAWRTLTIPFVGTVHLTLGTGTGELLSGPVQGVLPDLAAGFCFVFLRQSLTDVAPLIWNSQSPCLSLPGARTTGVCVPHLTPDLGFKRSSLNKHRINLA